VEAWPLPLEPMRGLESLSPSSLGPVGEVWRDGGPVESVRVSWEGLQGPAGWHELDGRVQWRPGHCP